MTRLKIENLDLTLYKEILDNKLTVYVLPSKASKEYKVTFLTNFGGKDLEFIPYGQDKMVKVPSGIAHFLEHKMKEVEKGLGPISFYAKSGAIRNASTSFSDTTYYFKGFEQFEGNLIYLLDLIQTPYFTDENVEREKNIILEELKRGQDMVRKEIFKMTLKNVFSKYNHRIPNIGTSADIKSITKEDLYTCYNTFYHPSNMALFITGNVNVDEVMSLIKQNQSKKEYESNVSIVRKSYDEPITVVCPFEEIDRTVKVKIARLTYKIAFDDLYGTDRYNKHTALKLLMEANFLELSDFDECLLKNNIHGESISPKFLIYDDYILISFIIESASALTIIELIKERMNNLEINDKILSLIEKNKIGQVITKYANLSEAHNYLVYSYVSYGEVITDEIKRIKSFTTEDIKRVIESLNTENYTLITTKK